MKRFLQRLSFSLTVIASLVSGSVLTSGALYAAETAVKTAKPEKAAAQVQSQLININKADILTLTQLKGVGEKKAQAIIAYRDEHGPFQSVEELSEVKGIGEAIVNANRGLISLN